MEPGVGLEPTTPSLPWTERLPGVAAGCSLLPLYNAVQKRNRSPAVRQHLAYPGSDVFVRCSSDQRWAAMKVRVRPGAPVG